MAPQLHIRKINGFLEISLRARYKWDAQLFRKFTIRSLSARINIYHGLLSRIRPFGSEPLIIPALIRASRRSLHYPPGGRFISPSFSLPINRRKKKSLTGNTHAEITHGQDNDTEVSVLEPPHGNWNTV